MIQLIAFDMDGTLVDSTNIVVSCVNRTLAHYGRPPLTMAEILPHFGKGARILLAGVMHQVGLNADIEECFSFYDNLYRTDPTLKGVPFEGVEETLKALKERGIRLVVLSNRPHHQTRLILGNTLPGLLDEVYGERSGVPPKPDPSALKVILKAHQLTEAECLYVGDMEVDMLLAENAGVIGVGCLWGFGGKEQLREAHHLIAHPRELLKLI